MRSLFLVTLGPVQDFIASARRTRDLQFGSWFLSEISRAAAHEISVRQHELLIFPAPENMEELEPRQHFNVANRILALIEQRPEKLAEQVRRAVYQRLHEIRDQAYRDIHPPLSEQQRIDADAQVEDLVELVWVALPLPDEQQYHSVRSQLETLIAARKNTHAFAQVTWGKPIPKSSLDGHLESVIPESEYPLSDASPDKRREVLEKLYKRYKVAGLGERLSGVDLLKRFGQTPFGAHFPSTSHLAVLPFLERMKRIDDAGTRTLRIAWENYVTQLETLGTTPIKEQLSSFYPQHPIIARYDGSLLFEGRLVDVLLLPSMDATNNKQFRQARDAQQAFYNALDEQFRKGRLSKTRPSTYYALLQADGDSMGDLIDAVAEQGYEQHRELSRALSRFAKSVRTIVVNDNQGALIYSGGDDVLAFLPLHTVLTCATALKDQFQEALKSLASRVDRTPPTLSVGIAIVHQLDSLREARRLASDAEKLAKQQGDKNALAIIVSKRSGEDYRVVGKWDNIDVRLSRLMRYCRTASIPAGMAYELRDMILRLSVPRTDPRYDALQNIIRVDALRILLRKLTVPAGKIPQKLVEEIEAFLRVQLALPPKEQATQQKTIQSANTSNIQEKPSLPPVSIETFINELVIAQMLSNAAELAQVKELVL